MERGIQSMADGHGLCLQDFVSGASNNGTSNDHLHNHHNLHDSVASPIAAGLMSTGNNSLNHLSHDASNQHHHHHHHSIANTPTLHEPLEKLKRKPFSFQFSIFVRF